MQIMTHLGRFLNRQRSTISTYRRILRLWITSTWGVSIFVLFLPSHFSFATNNFSSLYFIIPYISDTDLVLQLVVIEYFDDTRVSINT